MLVLEPEKRFTLNQILRHRWMGIYSSSVIEETKQTINNNNALLESNILDTEVVTYMLQLPNLTFDAIAESVHTNSFNNIYAIYNLLVDKIQIKRRDEQRLQHHAALAYSRYDIIIK